MKYISIRIIPSSPTAQELTPRTTRPLEPGELTTVQGGFGGGLSRENFAVTDSEPGDQGPSTP